MPRALISVSGLDSLRFLFEKLPVEKPDAVLLSKRIKSRITKIKLSSKIDFAIDFCEKRSSQLEENYKSAQSKAFTLMSAAGISTSFIVGFSSLLLDKEKFSQFPFGAIILPAFFILTVASLVLTVIFAAKTVTVETYYYPDHDNLYDLATKGLATFKREYVAILIECLDDNTEVLTHKLEYLSYSQKWFRNSIALIFMISLVLALAVLSSNGASLLP